MTPELLQKLKEAGFPQELKEGNMILLPDLCEQCNDYHHVYEPTLEGLIEACGRGINSIHQLGDGTWCADDAIFGSNKHFKGETPSEAVANLYLAINKK